MMVIDLLKGFIYGVFGILPGLSGGTIAVYTKDFDRLLDIFVNKDINIKNIKFICALLIGSILGIVIFSKILLSMFNKYTTLFKIIIIFINIFIMFDFYKKSKINLFQFMVAIIISIIFLIILRTIEFNFLNNNLLLIVFSSFFYSLGKVIPGISSTPLLINIGIYRELLIFYGNPISAILSKPVFWFLFWVIFLLYSFLLIKLLYKIKDRTIFYVFLVIVQIISILLLFR